LRTKVEVLFVTVFIHFKWKTKFHREKWKNTKEHIKTTKYKGAKRLTMQKELQFKMIRVSKILGQKSLNGCVKPR